ncbi:MAG: hypothetical protein RJB24_421 [Candidatus Parcubacteria bacterium]|jgi:hypothetical protein
MQNKKIIIVESITAGLLWATVLIIAISILGYIPIWTGGVFAGILGISYIATLSWYTCIYKMPPQITKFILIQILPLALIGVAFFDTITALIIVFTLILGIQTLFKAIKDINESMADHIKFRVKTIILPHTKGIIVWLMLLASVFIYGNTLRTNPNGIFLDEAFLNNQLESWIPVINQIAPDFDPNISVGNYVSDQLESQLQSQNIDSRLINKDVSIQQQINNLSDRFQISINRDTPIIQAFITYINKFITPWMSGPLWGIVVSLIVFLSFLPFIGIFQFGIRIITNLIKYYSFKSNLVKLSIKSADKENLSW